MYQATNPDDQKSFEEFKKLIPGAYRAEDGSWVVPNNIFFEKQSKKDGKL